MALFKYKGNRIRASDQHLVYRFCMGTLILLFLCIVVLLNLKQIVHTDWKNFNLTKMEFSLSSYNFITLLIAAGVCALVAFLYYRFCYDCQTCFDYFCDIYAEYLPQGIKEQLDAKNGAVEQLD